MTSPLETTSRMSEARLLQFFEACNAGDTDALTGFFTDDARYYGSIGPEDDGTVFTGIDEVCAGLKRFLSSFDDAHYSEVRVVVAGERGFAQWTFSGTRSSGERLTYRGVDLFDFRADRIRLKDAFRKERAQPIGS